MDRIVNHLVPELQERGIYPAEYAETMLLATPFGSDGRVSQAADAGSDMRDRDGWPAEDGSSVGEHDGGALVRMQLTVAEKLL